MFKQSVLNHIHGGILAAPRLTCQVVVTLQIGLADPGHDPLRMHGLWLQTFGQRAGRCKGKACAALIERAYGPGRVMLMHDVQAQLQIAGGLLHSLAYGKAP